ncbi:MAG: CRISPR-associated endonuclease Cas2 [Parcubacteria group bacterium]|nr:CRISPR-associated endonuclease Cas2 [Parcubacteria group bacterium]
MARTFFGTLQDALLVTLLFSFASQSPTFARHGIVQVSAAALECFKSLRRQRYFHRTCVRLREQNTLSLARYGTVRVPLPTSQGRARIEQLIPLYRENRPWDRRWRILIYDVPEEDRKMRDAFRYVLKHYGYGSLQASVFLTPYQEAIEAIDPYLRRLALRGYVLVADTQSATSIQGIHPRKLAFSVWHLRRLNARYRQFLDEFGNTNSGSHPIVVATAYWNILRDDPQLPFELLPSGWQGEEAHRLFQRFTRWQGFAPRAAYERREVDAVLDEAMASSAEYEPSR